MTDTQANPGGRPFDGQMYLYEQPELLTRQQHGSLGLSSPERPFDFARQVKALPIVVSEVSSVQKHYPVVFSNLDNPTLLAVLGIDNRNLFVDDDGRWERDSYVPAYLRCHPFALASGSEDQVAIVIDRSAAAISEKPEQPFFDGDSLSAATQARVEMSARFASHQKHTRDFCQRLKELGLLTSQQVTHRANGEETERTIATFVAVDVEKLQNLDADAVVELHRQGWLSAIFGQLFSSENWHLLVSRKQRLGSESD